MAEIQRSNKSRPVITYDVPEEITTDVPAALGAGTVYKSIGMIELTADEELQASKRGGKDQYKIAFELAKASLREVNDKPVSSMDGHDELVWASMSAPLRSLVVDVYADIHSPRPEVAKRFLSSRRVKVA